jgi:hypothetical protein
MEDFKNFRGFDYLGPKSIRNNQSESELLRFKGLIEDREFGFKDIEAGTPQVFDLDMDVAYPYRILRASLKTDTGTLHATVKINNVAITGLANVEVTSVKTRTNATALNDNADTQVVTIETNGIDSGTPTYLGGKLVIQRL